MQKGILKSEKIYTAARWLPHCVFLLLSLVLIRRCFFGFDWSDESFYAALSYRFFLGEPLFLSSWDIPQTASAMLLPLIAPYIWLRGNTDGILLYLRLLYTVAQCALAWYSCRVLKKHISCTGAFLASLFLFISPFCVRTFSYNNIPMLLLPLAFLLLLANQGALRFLLSGVCTALSALAYPPVILTVLVFLGYLFFRLYKKESTRRQLVWYMTGGIAVLLAFFIFLVCNSSVSNLLENYHRLLRDPEHQGTFSFIVYMGDMCRLAGGRYGVILLAVTGAAALYPFIKNAVCKRWVRISMITAALVYTWFLLQKNITENDLFNNKIYFCHILSIVGAVYMPALYLAGGRRRHGALLLYAVGLCFSTGIAIGSNNGKNGYTYALTLCAAATVIYLFAVLPKKRILYAVSIPPVLLVAVVFFIVNVTGVYRDEPLPALDTALVSGPAAGLYTTAENGEKYQEVIRTIHTYLPERGYVLYAQLLPFGYLCGENLYPATPRLWRLNLDYEGFPEYYDILPDHKPDILFIIKDGYGLQKNAPVWSDYMRELVNSEDFYRVDTECAVIYQLKTNNADKGLS